MVMATRIVAHKGVMALKTAVPEAGWQVWKGSIWDFISILTLDLASRTVKEYISVVQSHPVSGH